jgi:hypothetical protein
MNLKPRPGKQCIVTMTNVHLDTNLVLEQMSGLLADYKPVQHKGYFPYRLKARWTLGLAYLISKRESCRGIISRCPKCERCSSWCRCCRLIESTTKHRSSSGLCRVAKHIASRWGGIAKQRHCLLSRGRGLGGHTVEVRCVAIGSTK